MRLEYSRPNYFRPAANSFVAHLKASGGDHVLNHPKA
jgi:hypothetical protein